MCRVAGFPATVPHNQNISFFPITSASTWMTVSHPENGGSTPLRSARTLINYTAHKPKRDRQLNCWGFICTVSRIPTLKLSALLLSQSRSSLPSNESTGITECWQARLKNKPCSIELSILTWHLCKSCTVAYTWSQRLRFTGVNVLRTT